MARVTPHHLNPDRVLICRSGRNVAHLTIGVGPYTAACKSVSDDARPFDPDRADYARLCGNCVSAALSAGVPREILPRP